MTELEESSLLVVNAGSSSLRLALYRCTGHGPGRVRDLRLEAPAPEPAPIREFLSGEPPIDRVAHRFVHGGTFTRPCLIDPAVLAEMERVAPLAPLHNPAALAWFRVCRDLLGPRIPHVAVFDTAFFAGLPERATTYGLPRALALAHGLRRQGYHGIAHEAMGRAWRGRRPDLPLGGRLITLQLGAGCSATAISAGRVVDTSMGFTPLEGLLMATRCGDIDPGLILHLQRDAGIDAGTLERLLGREGGLAGISGVSGDLRVLLGSDEPAARLAIDVFCYRARKYVGAYMAALGGIDGIVIGGGAGEHLPAIRSGILGGLKGLGIRLDAARNDAAVGRAARISADTSPVEVWVEPVDEAAVIAEAAMSVR